ncbi:related to alpha/beta hydrolase [Phialocephala subalpina]|uniref:Related to alpha/beta hydrolase n=1 Tax=Phialocephala subalpina TaxID=576137 RepID=A0A1L7XR00_9HELO|nr:related to alpha/beta hydrolase [Phialocephala subalpina]
MTSPNPWLTSPSHSALISIGTHSLYLSASGPLHRPGIPSILIEAGHANCSNSWPAVVRLLAKFIRVYTYDRAGYGRSERAPSDIPRTAEQIATELDLLLKAASVPGPFVLVGHSYGGILIREFLALRPFDIKGLVFVDAVMEHDLDYEWPNKELASLGKGLDSYEARGLKQNSKLSPEEWEIFVAGEKTSLFEETSQREMTGFSSSVTSLKAKNQITNKVLGARRLYIIKADHVRDYRRILEKGIEAGNGTEEEREKMKVFCEGIEKVWMRNTRALIGLCEVGWWRWKGVGCGHQVQIEMPEVVVEGVEWVLGPLWWEVKNANQVAEG